MQNSGIGNAVNPLVSLADPDVYAIPVLLLIGWRGEPGTKDEPQHVKQGKITLDLLKTLGIPYEILPQEMEQAGQVLNKAVETMKRSQAPFALVVKKGTFSSNDSRAKAKDAEKMLRENFIELFLDNIAPGDLVVSTTGKTSRELFELREKRGQAHANDFLTVGSMGHASQIALGIALAKPNKKVYCLDGDGALLMHMGGQAIIGQQKPANLVHIVINNSAHESVGGQPTAAGEIDLCAVASACGYKEAVSVADKPEMSAALKLLTQAKGPVFLEVKVAKGARQDLGRPTVSPSESKQKFMESLTA